MPIVTKAKYNATQQAAMRLVASIGIRTLDAMTLDASARIYVGLYHQLAADTGISTQAARRHIYRAARRQRFPGWTPPDNWGGSRAHPAD